MRIGNIESYRWREIRWDGTVARRLFDAHRFIARILPELVFFPCGSDKIIALRKMRGRDHSEWPTQFPWT